MNELKLIKVKNQNAEIICHNVDLEKTSLSLINEKQSVSDYIQILLQHYALKDVIGVISQALPAREAIYWACLCIRDALQDKLDAENMIAIKAAEQWIVTPNEDNRYLNHNMAEKLEYATAAAWVANAVFWSGGSIMPQGETKVEAPEGVCGKAVCGAIMLASANEDLEKSQALQKRFIQRGINIAQGGKGDNV